MFPSRKIPTWLWVNSPSLLSNMDSSQESLQDSSTFTGWKSWLYFFFFRKIIYMNTSTEKISRGMLTTIIFARKIFRWFFAKYFLNFVFVGFLIKNMIFILKNEANKKLEVLENHCWRNQVTAAQYATTIKTS